MLAVWEAYIISWMCHFFYSSNYLLSVNLIDHAYDIPRISCFRHRRVHIPQSSRKRLKREPQHLRNHKIQRMCSPSPFHTDQSNFAFRANSVVKLGKVWTKKRKTTEPTIKIASLLSTPERASQRSLPHLAPPFPSVVSDIYIHTPGVIIN